jgi:hypothetical protein
MAPADRGYLARLDVTTLTFGLLDKKEAISATYCQAEMLTLLHLLPNNGAGPHSSWASENWLRSGRETLLPGTREFALAASRLRSATWLDPPFDADASSGCVIN